MAVQNRLDNQVVQFEFGPGDTKSLDGQTIAQDAGRGIVDMAKWTLMSLDPATNKWIPFINEAAVDGTELPRGYIRQKILAADIVAGDVVDIEVVVGDTQFNENLLVIEASKTLETVITSQACSVRSWLRTFELYAESAAYVDKGENPAV